MLSNGENNESVGRQFYQFYSYAKRKCTKYGYENAMENLAEPDLLKDPSLDLTNQVFLITGANSGIGFEIAKFLASKGAEVYMVCRDLARAARAKYDIITETKNYNVYILVCDCSLESDVRKTWRSFCYHRMSIVKQCIIDNDTELDMSVVKLNGIVCNAGPLCQERSMTSEGVEETIATNLVFGCYLLVELAIQALQSTQYSRVIVVSSAGIYTTKFPSWNKAASLEMSTPYDGEEIFCYAKRGQVLLCEQWSLLYPTIRFVSCHPGWVCTQFTLTAYKDVVSSMEPLRSPWQGAQGIAWLCVVPFIKLRRGAFYLDREKAPKHVIEEDYTRNNDAEIDEMMKKLRLWSNENTRPTIDNSFLKAAGDGITDGFGYRSSQLSKYNSWPSGPL